MRSFGLAFLAGSLLGLAGCGADNESEADRLQKGAGAPPQTNVKGGEPPPQASSLQQYAEQHKKDQSMDPMKSDYAKSVGAGRR
jgi:hypothetical protein